MHVELGGTTEVLDRGITETEEDREATYALAHAQSRKYTENHNQTTQRKRDKRLLTCSEKRDGDSAGSTRAFRGAESASRKPAQNGYGE